MVVHGDHAVDPAVGPAPEQLVDGGEVKHVELRHLGGGGELLGRHRLGFRVHNIPGSFEFSVHRQRSECLSELGFLSPGELQAGGGVAGGLRVGGLQVLQQEILGKHLTDNPAHQRQNRS